MLANAKTNLGSESGQAAQLLPLLLLLALTDSCKIIRLSIICIIILSAGFTIYFDENTYTVREDGTEIAPIGMVSTKTQHPFSLTVRPVSTDVAETLSISDFISDVTHPRATQGILYLSIINVFKF